MGLQITSKNGTTAVVHRHDSRGYRTYGQEEKLVSVAM
jgi:hypothetical protein